MTTDKKKTRKKNKKKMNLSASDYRKILKFYKLSIPKKLANLRKKGDKIIAKKFCSCIKKVRAKFKKEGIALSVCTKSVITRKAIKRGKFKCKKRRSIKLLKGRSKRSKRRAKKKINQSGGTFGDDSTYDSDDGSRVESSSGSEEEDDIHDYEYKKFPSDSCPKWALYYVKAIINKLKEYLKDLKKIDDDGEYLLKYLRQYHNKYKNDNFDKLLSRMDDKDAKSLNRKVYYAVNNLFEEAVWELKLNDKRVMCDGDGCADRYFACNSFNTIFWKLEDIYKKMIYMREYDN